MIDTPHPGPELFDVSRLRLAEGAAPALSPALEAARDRAWENAVRGNPTLFDGPAVACVELRRVDPDTLFLRWAAVTYRHRALRRVPGAEALPSLFVNAVQPTPDGRVLVVRMAAWTATPGRWQFPGGSVEPPGAGEVLDEASLRGHAARELVEEIGVDVEPTRLRLWAATRGAHGSVGLTHFAPSRPEADVRERFAALVAAERAAGRDAELDAIAFVRSPAELAALAGPHVDYLEPLVRRCTGAPHRPEA
ncbi:NUDIX domain-containing protein [Streptomyces sp. NPDC001568]|uniref:NUDIX domain-containing protein n=1 Tax=Streptomyces sp. NPDC001568 TaxID=3364588 RepID=UPI00368B9E53